MTLDFSHQRLRNLPPPALIWDQAGGTSCRLLMNGNQLNRVHPSAEVARNVVWLSLRACQMDRFDMRWLASARIRELDVSENRIQRIDGIEGRFKMGSFRVLKMS